MTSGATSNNANETSQFVRITPKEYENRVLLRLALKYKDRLPEKSLLRLSQALPTFMDIPPGSGNQELDIREIFPLDMPREAPIYVQGDAGVGKTEIPESAARRFCEITGLRFIKDPPDDYIPGDQDFVYTIIDMSGKTNISDVAGMVGKVKLQSKSIMRDVLTSAMAISSYSGADIKVSGTLSDNDMVGRIIEVSANDVDEEIASDAANTIVEMVTKIATEHGMFYEKTKNPSRRDHVAVNMEKTGKGKFTITISEPKPRDIEASSLIPSKQLARLGAAKFGLLMVDDLGNCHQHLRNVFLQLALNGAVEGVCDIRHIDMVITANPPKTRHGLKNKNVISERSFPEITRSQTFELIASPKDWLEWVSRQEIFSKHGDAHFHSFISMHGEMPGIFQMHPDTSRYEEGAPVPVPRSISRAMNSALKWYVAAKSIGHSVSIYRKQIEDEVAACCGKEFASSYISHVVAMETEAIPMAKKCIDTGYIDKEKILESVNARFSSGLDFGYRFAYALADMAATRLVNPNEKDNKDKILENMFRGLSVLPQDSMITASLARFVNRLEMSNQYGHESLESKTGRAINVEMATRIAKAFGKTMSEFSNPEQMEENVKSIVSGYHNPDTNARTANKIRP